MENKVPYHYDKLLKQGMFESVGNIEEVLVSETSNKMLFGFYHKCYIPGRRKGIIVFKVLQGVGFGVMKFEICFSFCFTVMTPLLHHWWSIRNLMTLCTGIPTDHSVMIMTGQGPILKVSLQIQLKEFKSTSLSLLFQWETHYEHKWKVLGENSH